jgi:hypothetical protein
MPVGGGTLEWQLSADQTWIEIGPPLTGSGAATVSVRINLTQIPANQPHNGLITVASNGGVETVEVHYAPLTGTQAGAVMLFSDPGFNSCNISDVAGPVSVYVVHDLHSGASGVQFSAPIPSCWTGAVWVADQNPNTLNFGDSQNGLAVSYGGCLSGPVLVTTILVLSQGLGPECCTYPVLPDPNAPTGQIEGVDCTPAKTFPNGGQAMINGNGTCPCGITTRVETTTWGGVKALYAPEENR